MRRTTLLALAASLVASPAAFTQAPPEMDDIRRDADLTGMHDPRIGAEVRTAAGDLVGRVSRLEFETEAQSVVRGYLVGLTDLTGRERRQIYIRDDQAVWTDLSATPVLQVSMTRNEIEEMPNFADTRPAAYEFNDQWTGDVDVEATELLRNPDTPRPVGDPDPLLGTDELTAQIEWDADFNAEDITQADWGTMTAFTHENDPFGVVTGVRSEDGAPARLVVQTLPDYYDLGILLVFDIADIEAVSESRSAFQVDPGKGREA